jgi:hypothetical protein
MKEEIKEHVVEHKVVYAFAGGIIFAGITCYIMRDIVNPQPISRDIAVTAQRDIAVLGEKVVSQSVIGNENVLHNVSYFISNRQGPPSWVVRCKETGELFTSQNSAAREMNISSSELSKHLRGGLTEVRGHTFERICMTV